MIGERMTKSHPFFINTLYNNKCISMIFLHGLSTNDELYKHYIGGNIADAIVVGGTTYTFSGSDTDGYGYLWVNGNDIIYFLMAIIGGKLLKIFNDFL